MLPKRLASIVVSIALVLLFIGRGVPRAWLAGNTFGVVAPIVGALIVGICVAVISLHS